MVRRNNLRSHERCGCWRFHPCRTITCLSFAPGTKIVLFLHGAKYTSENWVNLGTLKLLNEKGYRTAAVDIPGFGKTRSLPYIDNNMRAEFLKVR